METEDAGIARALQKLAIEHLKRREELKKLQKYVDEQAQNKENSRKVQEQQHKYW